MTIDELKEIILPYIDEPTVNFEIEGAFSMKATAENYLTRPFVKMLKQDLAFMFGLINPYKKWFILEWQGN